MMCTITTAGRILQKKIRKWPTSFACHIRLIKDQTKAKLKSMSLAATQHRYYKNIAIYIIYLYYSIAINYKMIFSIYHRGLSSPCGSI